MTEGQWLWMLINMSIDNDEQMAKVCKPCQEKTKEDRCISCNSLLSNESNPNFDEELFEKLKKQAE